MLLYGEFLLNVIIGSAFPREKFAARAAGYNRERVTIESVIIER
jgi:hypothetical protein